MFIKMIVLFKYLMQKFFIELELNGLIKTIDKFLLKTNLKTLKNCSKK